MGQENPKSFSEFEEKDWRNFVIYLTLLGVVMAGFGVYKANFTVLGLGGIFVAIGVIGGFVLHTIFGIDIVNIRTDLKHTEK